MLLQSARVDQDVVYIHNDKLVEYVPEDVIDKGLEPWKSNIRGQQGESMVKNLMVVETCGESDVLMSSLCPVADRLQ